MASHRKIRTTVLLEYRLVRARSGLAPEKKNEYNILTISPRHWHCKFAEKQYCIVSQEIVPARARPEPHVLKPVRSDFYF